MLGVGPDGHVASLFPEHAGAVRRARRSSAVRGSPKPPPTRISLTLPDAPARARGVGRRAGEDKAKAVHLALSGAGAIQVPAAGARGRDRTLWLLDQAAASELPSGLARL